MKLSLCETLSRFICRARYEDLPAPVIHSVKRALLDTVGVAIGALADKESEVILGYAKSMSQYQNGLSSVWGQGYHTLPELAAMVNGTLAHLLDFDDSHNPMGGHPSAPLVPTVLALAEQIGSTGRDAILAFAIGFEIETKLSRITNPILYSSGWHPTSVLSIFGATAAAASLLKLDEATTAYALATAASLSSGIKGNFGTLTKSLHVGKAAQHGIQAAYLASYGMTSNIHIFETNMGFLHLFCSPNSKDWKISEMGTLGDPWEIVDPGITVKPYPCCGSTHTTVDAHMALRQTANIDPSNISWIKNFVHERRMPHTDRPVIISGLEGKFSNQYVTALVWTKGSVSLEYFDDQTFRDPQIMDMMRKVEFKADPEISKTTHETHARIEVGLMDGRVFTYKVTKRKGSPQNPLSDSELEAKFKSCVYRVHTNHWMNSVLENIQQLDQMANISVLSDRLVKQPTIKY